MTDGVAFLITALVFASMFGFGAMVGWCLREECGDD